MNVILYDLTMRVPVRRFHLSCVLDCTFCHEPTFLHARLIALIRGKMLDRLTSLLASSLSCLSLSWARFLLASFFSNFRLWNPVRNSLLMMISDGMKDEAIGVTCEHRRQTGPPLSGPSLPSSLQHQQLETWTRGRRWREP